MKSADDIFEILKKEFGDSILGIDKETPTEPIISVDPLQVYKVSKFLRENSDLQFDSLMCLS
ncbi:MAG: NADH-quinone oxidoreductase subunit C, partial [Ignavibacteria bacterium]|nr:NADH-quinone oxidoreductase subunit C [Ignavibacteria bacterium]